MSFSNLQSLAVRVSQSADQRGDRPTSELAGLIKELAVALESSNRDIKYQIQQLQQEIQRQR